MIHDTMEIDKLGQWKIKLEAEIQSIRDDIQSLNSKLQQRNQQLDLICRLIGTESSSVSGPDGPIVIPSAHSVVSNAVSADAVKNNVHQILAEAKRPMNIKEIHAEFIRRGYPIPGKGTHFNILVHVGRDLKKGKSSRFRRDGRGTYSLRPSRVERAKKTEKN